MNKLNEYYPVLKEPAPKNIKHDLPKVSNSVSAIENSAKQTKRDSGTTALNERSVDFICPKKTENRKRNQKCSQEKTFNEPFITKVPLRNLKNLKENDFPSDSGCETVAIGEFPKPPERIKIIKIFPQVPRRTFLGIDQEINPVPLPRHSIKRFPRSSPRKSDVITMLNRLNEQEKKSFLTKASSSSSLSSQNSEICRHITVSKFIKRSQILSNNLEKEDQIQEAETTKFITSTDQSEKQASPKHSQSDSLSNDKECSQICDSRPFENGKYADADDKTRNPARQENESNIFLESQENKIDSRLPRVPDGLQHNASNSAAAPAWGTLQGETGPSPKLNPSKTPSNPEVRASRLSCRSKSTEVCLAKVKQNENSNKPRTIKSQIASQLSVKNSVTPISEEGMSDSSETILKSETKINNSQKSSPTYPFNCDPRNTYSPNKKLTYEFNRGTCNKTSSTPPQTKKNSLTQTDVGYQLKCTEPLSNEMIDINLSLPGKSSKSPSSFFASPVESTKKSSKMTLMSYSPEDRKADGAQTKYSVNSTEIAMSVQSKNQNVPISTSKPSQTMSGLNLVPIPQVFFAHAYRTIESLNYDKIPSRVIESLQGTLCSDIPKYEEPRKCLVPFTCQAQVEVAADDLLRKDSLVNVGFLHNQNHIPENVDQSKNQAFSCNNPQFASRAALNDSEINVYPSTKLINKVNSFHKDSMLDVNSLAASVKSKLDFLKTMNSKPDYSWRLPPNLDSGKCFNYLSEQLERSGDQIRSTRQPLPLGSRSPQHCHSTHGSPRTHLRNADSHRDGRTNLDKTHYKQFTRHSHSTHHRESGACKSQKFFDEKGSTCRSKTGLRCRNEDPSNSVWSEASSEESIDHSASCESQSFCKSSTTLSNRQKCHNFSAQNCSHNSAWCGRSPRNSPKVRVMMIPASSSRNSCHRHYKHNSPSFRNAPQISGSALFRAAANVTREFTSASLGRKRLQKPSHFAERIEELKRILAEGLASRKSPRQHDIRERMPHLSSRNSPRNHDGNRHYYVEPAHHGGSKSYQCFTKGSYSTHNRASPKHFQESPRFFLRDSNGRHPHHFHSKSPFSHHQFKSSVPQGMHSRNPPMGNWHHPSRHSSFNVKASCDNFYGNKCLPPWGYRR